MNSITVKAPPSNNIQSSQPKVPKLLARPISLIPETIRSAIIVKTLNVILAQALGDGELEFLTNQQVSVAITDLKLKFALGLRNHQLVAKRWQASDDLNLSGCLYDFMLLASRQEDSDTLFFHRRLKMEGSTDLGLEVKNLLDGMDMETVRLHHQLDFTLQHGIKLFEKLFK
jgi:predicted lipid carrier protein YhbT